VSFNGCKDAVEISGRECYHNEHTLALITSAVRLCLSGEDVKRIGVLAEAFLSMISGTVSSMALILDIMRCRSP